MSTPTGREILLDVLRSEGVRHIFGNPGSTELPLIDALATTDDPRYVLALQEATVVGMADGYAQVTGRPAFLNLHTSAGLGNAIGNLTNAQANRTPLVVTAGNQDRRHLATDPLLGGDLVGLARGTSKWAQEVMTLEQLGVLLRRAFHDAAAAPAGPVFLSLPMDVLDEAGDVAVPGPSRLVTSSVAGGLDELAELLVGTTEGRLAIVATDEVSATGAAGALVAVAEALGAPVLATPLHSTTVFPPAHPLFAGTLPVAAAAVRGRLAGFDRVLAVGARPFMAYPYSPGPAVPPEVELVQVSADAASLGRTYPVRLGLLGDPKATLEALLPLLEGRVDRAAAAGTLAAAREARQVDLDRLEASALERYDAVPMEPMAAAHALVRALPPETPVVDEAITTGGYVRGFHHVSEPGRYFFCRGGGLGWGMPAALGVSLGYDRAPVLSVVGDGSAMYSPQALWTAAREELPVVFAVVNNRQYLILKNVLRTMKGDSVREDRFVAMDLDRPAVDFVGLARSMGVEGTIVEKAADVGDAVRAALEAGRPHLLELPISAP